MTRWTSCRASGHVPQRGSRHRVQQGGRTACGTRRHGRHGRRRRVVVTGLGVVSPIGVGHRAFLEGLRSGRSAVGPISRFDAAGLSCRLAAEVERELLPAKPPAVDWATHYAVVAASEAVADAGLDDVAGRPDIGISIGATKAGPELLEEAWLAMSSGGPMAAPNGMARNLSPGGVSEAVAAHLGLVGPRTAVAAACSTGAHNIIWAAEMVADGHAEAAVAGSTDAPIVPTLFASFANLRNVMTTHNERGPTAVRPFCATRDGLAMGEGAAAVVVEALDHARRRSATIYGELAGWALAAEAAHLTGLPTRPHVPARAICRALDMAHVLPSEIDYICAHGTATRRNDPYETDAYTMALGEEARRVPISSIKAMVGHSMAAAAAIDAVATLLAMEHGFVPATINYHEPDPQCDLDYVPNIARSHGVTCALSPSFAFGGHVGVLLFRKA